jgi:hypothetical protein
MRPVTISIVLLVSLATHSATAAQVEPNDAPLKLKFETSAEPRDWTVRGQKTEGGTWVLYDNPPGLIKPTHIAEVVLHTEYPRSTSERGVLEKIQDSPIAKKFSKAQQEFLKTGFAVWVEEESRRIPNHFSTWLYAASEDDAKLMASAYIDGLNAVVNQRLHEYKRHLHESQQKLEAAQKELPEKQAKLKACEEQYKPVREARHQFESDDEAAKSSQQTLTEMNRMLDTLEIELIGTSEKLNTIEKYRKGQEKLSSQLYLKLDEMFIEQTIELGSIEARRHMAEQIRAKEQRFLGLLTDRSQLRRDVEDSKALISSLPELISHVTHELENPTPDMLPPKVYQDKVTVWRIKGGYTPEEEEKLGRMRRDMEKEFEKLYKMELQPMTEEEPGAH